jgi:hypothetical protein
MPSSTIDKALSSTKSFIETFTSSDNPTTTFTEHTVASVTGNQSIISKILGFVSQPKFKWYILGLLLCITAFIYFKFQNRANKGNKENKEHLNVETKDSNPVENKNQSNENINILLEERDKEWVNKLNSMKQQYNTQLATQADVNAQLITQLQSVQRQNTQQSHQSAPKQSKKPVEQ